MSKNFDPIHGNPGQHPFHFLYTTTLTVDANTLYELTSNSAASVELVEAEANVLKQVERIYPELSS